MIDVPAALALSGAAARLENPVQLVSDATRLYELYAQSKIHKLDYAKMAETGDLKQAVQAVARLANVAAALMDDPIQKVNIASLLSSI